MGEVVHWGTGTPIDRGGGGPHDPGMEARVAKLEVDVGEIKATAARIESAVLKVGDTLVKTREDLAELKGRVSQIPNALQIVGIVFAVNAGAIALGGLAIAILKALKIL